MQVCVGWVEYSETYNCQFKDFPNRNHALQSRRDDMFIAARVPRLLVP